MLLNAFGSGQIHRMVREREPSEGECVSLVWYDDGMMLCSFTPQSGEKKPLLYTRNTCANLCALTFVYAT